MPPRHTRPLAAVLAGLGLLLLAGGLPAYAAPTPTPAPTRTAAPTGSAGPDEQELAKALQRDLGMSVEQFRQQAATSEQAATLATKLEQQPEYYGVSVHDGRITVRGRGAAVEQAAAAAGARVSDPGPQAVKPAELATKFRQEVGSDVRYAVKTTTDQVVLQVAEPDRSTGGKTPAQFAAEQGVPVERLTVVTPHTDLRGGERYTASNLACSWGFALVTAQADPALLSAGHCANYGMGNIARTPSGAIIGTLDWYQFGDRADLSVYATLQPGMTPVAEVTGYANAATAINDWFEPPVGTPVCAAGATTGALTCGTVTDITDFMVHWNDDNTDHLVTGFGYDRISRPGDSGGAVFAGNRAVGVVSGGADTKTYASSLKAAMDRGYKMMLPQPQIRSYDAGSGQVRGSVPTGSGLPANTRVRVTMGSRSATVPVDGSGNFSFTSLGADQQRLQTVSDTGASVQQAWSRDLGNPTGDQVCGLSQGGCVRTYQGGTLAWSSATGWHVTRNAIGAKWAAVGREGGRLGYPTTDEICGLTGGGCYQLFTGGAVLWSPATGTHTS
ncbi:trypsin-like serine protease, partial [Granulicoccus phenolivorans]